MEKSPNLCSVESLLANDYPVKVLIDGVWVPHRGEGYHSFFHRCKLAWGVFTGRYDALTWPKGQ